MVSVDKNTFWDLAQTVMWICTRDEQRVAAISDMNENEKLSLALFGMKVEMVIRSRPGPSGSNLGADLARISHTGFQLEAVVRAVHGMVASALARNLGES